MAEKTGIEWCDHTFNPWWGCLKVSAGCEHCYAETLSKRFGKNIWGPAKTTTRRTFGDKHWNEPIRWQRKAEKEGITRYVFCGSMCDFAEDHPVANVERKRLWRTIKATPALTWLLLTKRPERLPEILPYDWEDGPYTAWHNVWLMTSVEDMRAIERVDHLLKVPAIVHGLSIEPLIGPVTLTGRGYNDIEWVIIGGESAQQGKYRPMQKRWLDDLLSECYQKTSVFVKQMGTEWAKRYGYADKKGGDWSEWSEDYRIRFHPTPNIRRIIA